MARKRRRRAYRWWEESYVYMMRAEDCYYKIGIARNPKVRRGQIQTSCPLRVEIDFTAGMMPRAYAENLEAATLEDLKEYRCQGEWVRVEDRALIESVQAEITRCVKESQKGWRGSEPPYVSIPGRWE